MSALLLDTGALIWWDANDPRLGGHARTAIQDASEVYVSAASAWEIVIKSALGKLRTTRRPAKAVADGGFRELAVTFDLADGVLRFFHREPMAMNRNKTVKRSLLIRKQMGGTSRFRPAGERQPYTTTFV